MSDLSYTCGIPPDMYRSEDGLDTAGSPGEDANGTCGCLAEDGHISDSMLTYGFLNILWKRLNEGAQDKLLLIY